MYGPTQDGKGVSCMSDFQITGISSGIDWGSIIDTMMESKRAVETQWYEEQEKLDTKALLYEELAANLSRLQGSLDPLKRESTFLSKSVAVTPTAGTAEPVTVTASPEAEIARFNIDVISVASNHRVAGNRYDDADAALGLEGSFDLSLGDFTVTVDVSSDQSLKDVAATVNAAVAQQAQEAGIAPPLSAQVLDNTLILEAKQTGSENALSVTDTDGLLATLGIVDWTGNFTKVLQEPADAQITLDGLEVTRSSNTIDDLIEGLTIEVTTPGSAQVDVSLDAEPAVAGVTSMLEAYNETLDWINIRLTEESEEDPESDVEKKWGLLKGDRLLWSCKQDMRSITSKIRYDLEGKYKSLSSIGITTESVDFGKSGKLQFDESAFMEAMLDDPRSVEEVLRSFAEEMQNFTKQMVSGTPENVGGTTVKTGTIINRIDSLEERSSQIDERIADFEARLAMEQASLEKLYANMETRLSELNQQSFYFSALLDQGLSNSQK